MDTTVSTQPLTQLQRTGLRPEQYGRHAPAFLGSKIPVERIHGLLDGAGFELAGIRGAGTLFAWATARRR